MSQLIIILIALFVTAFLINRYAGLHRNISLLFLAQPLVTSVAPLMVFIGGIIAQPLAPDPSLATLPLTAMIIGTAAATIPAAMLAQKLGRRNATMIGFLSTIVGALVALFSINKGYFFGFVAAAFIMGFTGAFSLQLRFAAMESLADVGDMPKAISLLMLTGIFSAMLGPELAFFTKDLLSGFSVYSGTFVGLIILAVIAIAVVSQFQPLPEKEGHTATKNSRPLTVIMAQPVFIVAIVAAALGFGLMSFVMTATPLSMHQLHDHSLAHTKWVIQSHVAAMYLPSLLTVWLGKRIATRYFLLVGTLMFIGVVVVASQGHDLLHYWWALILLGIGWNFLFYAGTTLLPLSYESHERHLVQAINDFSVLTFQGLSSLMAGWVLFHYQWSGILLTCIPFLVIMVAVTVLGFIDRDQHTVSK